MALESPRDRWSTKGMATLPHWVSWAGSFLFWIELDSQNQISAGCDSVRLCTTWETETWGVHGQPDVHSKFQDLSQRKYRSWAASRTSPAPCFPVGECPVQMSLQKIPFSGDGRIYALNWYMLYVSLSFSDTIYWKDVLSWTWRRSFFFFCFR